MCDSEREAALHLPDVDPGIALHMGTMEDYASRAGVIIELGCAHGTGSTRALTLGLRRSKALFKLHISVDIDPIMPVLRPLDDWWHVVHGSSTDPLTVIEADRLLEGRKADLIFIDTVHDPSQISSELLLWYQFSCRSTHWLFHDTWEQNRGFVNNYNPMTDCIKRFAAANRCRYEDLSKECNGLGHMWGKINDSVAVIPGA